MPPDMEKRHPVLPPFYFLGGLLVMFALDYWFPVLRVIPGPWNLLGGLLMLSGVAITITGAGTFRTADTPVRPFEPSSALVTHGVFRWSRNPMYLGMTLALCGTAVLFGSLAPWIVPPLFMAVIRHFFIGPEEELMEQTFGERYRSYREGVRRWL